jgi:flagellar motor protein MotB
MARKKKHPEHVNHERWLISYADFITLLFAFFVVMFAVSQVDTKQVGRFTESFTDALEWQVFDTKGARASCPPTSGCSRWSVRARSPWGGQCWGVRLKFKSTRRPWRGS